MPVKFDAGARLVFRAEDQHRYQLRGIKGPMGTAADQLQVLGGDVA